MSCARGLEEPSAEAVLLARFDGGVDQPMLTAGRTTHQVHSVHRSTDVPGVFAAQGKPGENRLPGPPPTPAPCRPSPARENPREEDVRGSLQMSSRRPLPALKPSGTPKALLACCEGRPSKSPRPRVCRRVQRPQPAEPTGPIQPDSGPHDPSPSGHTLSFTSPAVFGYAFTILHGCNLYTVCRGPEWLVHVSLRWVFRLARRQP
jgi:hypothetical protein